MRMRLRGEDIIVLVPLVYLGPWGRPVPAKWCRTRWENDLLPCSIWLIQMKNARVAVITRTKNRAILLKRAIPSVLGQKYQDWTHVIVNDGGDPDEVRSVVAPHVDGYRDRITLIDNPTSVGMEAASNIGIRACSSEFIVIHDDDDTWAPDFLSRCIEFMDATTKPRLGCDYGGVIAYSLRIIEEIEGEGVRTVTTEPFNTWMTSVSLYRLAAGNTFPPISFLFRRDVWEEVGCFREDLPVLGDWDFHLRVCVQYEIGLIPELLANYHHRVSIRSGEYGNTVIAANAKHRAYENLYRNELLRQDLAAGRTGLGFLVGVVSSFEHVHGQIWPVEQFFTRLRANRWVRRLATLLR
ncbi:glycosyltransferase, group 2 family protein [delta proteobacterium NaphS2]|nr:glycosyltransferase, group 2 family protein [delta proteobacterium NaphS2]